MVKKKAKIKKIELTCLWKKIELICLWCNVDLREDEKVYCTSCKRLREWRGEGHY